MNYTKKQGEIGKLAAVNLLSKFAEIEDYLANSEIIAKTLECGDDGLSDPSRETLIYNFNTIVEIAMELQHLINNIPTCNNPEGYAEGEEYEYYEWDDKEGDLFFWVDESGKKNYIEQREKL